MRCQKPLPAGPRMEAREIGRTVCGVTLKMHDAETEAAEVATE
jgi:hypothetical protein